MDCLADFETQKRRKHSFVESMLDVEFLSWSEFEWGMMWGQGEKCRAERMRCAYSFVYTRCSGAFGVEVRMGCV